MNIVQINDSICLYTERSSACLWIEELVLRLIYRNVIFTEKFIEAIPSTRKLQPAYRFRLMSRYVFIHKKLNHFRCGEEVVLRSNFCDTIFSAKVTVTIPSAR